MATLNGNEVASNVKHSQVFLATHDGKGRTLPFMHRSFISFTYGGKKIEDFDLIATIDGDRLNKPGYASFEDTVTTYDNLDGQHYWTTHYKINQLDFTLSTDGIDEKQLNEFLYWFKAGVHRELILAEHPNRAIMARVAEPPTINMLPFEQEIQFIINERVCTTKTTLYKGDINLSLVMDEPHWYGLTNILGKRTVVNNQERYENIWYDYAQDAEVEIYASQDALKILYEDGIPMGDMIKKNMLLGNGEYANAENKIISLTWSKNEDDEDFANGEGARIEADPGTGQYGVIAGAIVNASGNGITSLAKDTPAYFFYSGTAPSPTIITFTIEPSSNWFDSNNYFVAIKNRYVDSTYPYNEFIVESLTQQVLRFTTPNLFTSYNEVIKVFYTYLNNNNSWETVRAILRDTIRHPKIRAYAISILNAAENNSSSIVVDVDASSMTQKMKKFFVDNSNQSQQLQPVTFTFNSKTGEAIGSFGYYPSGTNQLEIQEEDVGDMLRSNYIIIQDRNHPTAIGTIECWTEEHKEYSHRIMHDVNANLCNIQILYKNMYL